MHSFHHPDEGKSMVHRSDSDRVAGEHGLKSAVEELREEHAKGAPHLPVSKMKGLDRK